jgi:hypothetical protein
MKMAEAQKRRREQRAAREAVELENANWGTFAIKLASIPVLVAFGLRGALNQQPRSIVLIVVAIIAAASAVAQYRRIRQR